MPFLSGNDRKHYAKQTTRKCELCGSMVHNEYCSRCDEWYSVNHVADCPLHDKKHGSRPGQCGGDRGLR